MHNFAQVHGGRSTANSSGLGALDDGPDFIKHIIRNAFDLSRLSNRTNDVRTHHMNDPPMSFGEAPNLNILGNSIFEPLTHPRMLDAFASRVVNT